MSPANASLISSRLFACISSIRPIALALVLDRVHAGTSRSRSRRSRRATKVSEPTNGSFMILKASAGERRVVARPRARPPRRCPASMPSIGGTSSGDGRKSTTASSSGCTPLFLKAEPHSTGTSLHADRALARGSARSGLVRLVPLEVGLHHASSSISTAASISSARSSAACVGEFGRDRRSVELRAEGLLVPDRSPSSRTDRPRREVVLERRSATGSTTALAPRRSLIIDDAAVEVGADAVHLVDEADPRHAVLVGLAPDRLRLRLDAGDAVEHRHRTVEHAQGTLDLDGEVDVARACR